MKKITYHKIEPRLGRKKKIWKTLLKPGFKISAS